MTASIVDGFVETPRLRMHYRAGGKPGGMPMLLIHGGFATSRWWLPLMSVLPEEFFVIAPDLRGCGQSDKPVDGYAIESLAEDVAACAFALGLGPADIVGHAEGGAISMELVLRRKELARSLTLICTAPVEGVVTPPDAMRLLAQMRDDHALLRSALTALMPVTAREDPNLFASIVEDAEGMAPAAFTDIAAGLGAWNRLGDASQLTGPTLLLWGDEDVLVTRESMTRTLLAIPGANNLEVLKGIGHCPALDAPLRTAEKIVDFVTEDIEKFQATRTNVHN